MARKTIDIGTIGNDGTGDSIRDAFRKVNDNFRELYSSLGLGERLQFRGLDDTPNSYVGQENALLTVNTTEEGIAFRRLIAGTGVQIDFSTDENSIILTNLLADISGDSRPNLGGALNAESGGIKYPIGNLLDLSIPAEASYAKTVMEVQHGVVASNTDRLAANKGYADTKISLAGVNSIDPATGSVDTRFGTMTGPLILSRDPIPEDDAVYDGLIAATKRYVDSSGFGSAVNLYVATSGSDDRANVERTLQGRSLAYAYKTIESALKKAEEIVLDAPLEMGPYRKILTYGNGEGQCYLSDIDFTNGIPVTPATFTVFMSSDTIELENGGNLYLPGDKLTIVTGPGTAIEPIRLEVLSVIAIPGTGGRGRIQTFKVLTSGVYSVLPGSSALATTATSSTGGTTFGTGATFNITYKLNNIAVGGGGGSGYGLVSITFQGGGGSGASARAEVVAGVITGVTVTNKGSGYTSIPTITASLPRFFIYVGANIGTDFTGDVSLTTPEAIRARDIREGLLLRGETSGALAQILAHTGALYVGGDPERQNTEIFDVDVLSGEFIQGEVISYGDVTKSIQISIFVESGIYEENLPLKIPQNVAIIGDEFRRTIIRPRGPKPNAPQSGMSSSPWAFLNYRRDPIFDGLEVTEQLYGYHYLSDPTIPVRPLINNNGNRRAAAEILDLNREFIKSQVIGWINNQIINDVAPFVTTFSYDQNLCRRDIGLLIDAMVFDLKFGGYARTISAALKYFQSVSALTAIIDQDLETQAGIQRINTLAQDVILNNQITTLYTLDGVEFSLLSPTNTLSPPVDQIIDEAYVAETGSGAVISTLVSEIITIISAPSGDVNFPKDNDKLDIFLCNDANIIRAVTCQGHGGFMMVLDPEGQILTKSPYCQESACFSLSTGRQTFAGGMFVDGFTGNQRFFIDSSESGGIILNISGLLRPPETPCSFIVSDTIYRVNYIRNYIYGTFNQGDPGSTTVGGFSSCQLILDELTPFTGAFANVTCTISGSPGEALFTAASGHGLQIRAIVQFQSTGTLPAGIQTLKDYYVVPNGFTETTFKVTADWGTENIIEITSAGSGTFSFRRVFEILMPGNRSMLSNDFTQVNDMGYGLVTANGGLTEAVSMFTYYCHISYLALTGGQIRSIGGSSSHGNYGLVAKGSDPLEVPTPVGLYHNLAQGATVYSSGAGYVNQREDTFIYVIYDDYFPLAGSELEINHNNQFVRYAVSSVALDDLATKRVRLNIQSSGGLESAVNDGQRVTIRQNSFVVLTGDIVEVATRPSTALVLNDGVFVYRVLEFNDYDSTFDKDDIGIASINTGTGLFTTTIPHRQIVNYPVKIEKISGALPSAIVAQEAGPPEVIGNIYYVIADGLTPTTFKLSATKGGPVLDLSGGPAFAGVSKIRPYGLAYTQLRENYSYTVLDLYPFQPFRTPGSLTSCTINTVTNSVVAATTPAIGTQIRFIADDYPSEITTERHYWVVTASYSSGVSFRISDYPPIGGYSMGVGSYNATTGRITGLKSTTNLADGQTLRPRSPIAVTGASGNGSVATLTFAEQARPPFYKGQIVTISGMNPAGYDDATATVLSCTTTALTYANSTVASFTSGGTIAVPTGGGYGTLPTNATIAVGGIISSTEIAITGAAGAPASGLVYFDVEGVPIDFDTTPGTNVRFGTVIGDQGQTTIAVTDLPAIQETRVLNSELYYEGQEYTVTGYTPNPGGELYSLITLNAPLHVSAVSYRFPIALRSGVAVPSTGALGTLTIRIALVRVTSHDFLEIGTGSYADTNYPNDIFGLAVNDFNSVPLYTTDTDAEGVPITRAQVQERDVGRVFFVTTDQYGNFSVGPFFKVDQGTGTVTFSASIALSQLDGLGFKRGATVSEFSVDDRMQDESNDAVPTEGAVASYLARRLGTDRNGTAVIPSNLIPASTGGFLALSGTLSMKGNLNAGGFRVENIATPVAGTDAARLEDINLTNLKDTDGTDLFNFTTVSAAQILAMTGDQNSISNFTVTGDVTFDFNPGDSTISVIRSDISPGVITNTEVDASAAIAQSKLSMNAATARVNAVGITQADRGLASFNDSEFTLTNGWAEIKTNGLALTKLAQIPLDTVLGRSTGAASGDVTTVGFSVVVDEGGAVKKSQYSASVGYLKRTNATVGNFTLDAHYSLIQDDANATANTLVIRDGNADFAGRIITAEQFNIKVSSGTYQALKGNQVSTTSGYTELYGYNGGGGSSFVGVQIGAGTSLNRTIYNNNEHSFRSQDGTSTYGTFSSTGLSVGNLTVTAASLASCTSISTGAEATTGTVTGRWSLVGTSRWESTYSADLAEYYEGDQEYEVGTVLIFGGDKEVTISTSEADTRVAGIVSDTAAYSMYGACPGMKNQIALQGRVKCKVIGKISKGDILVTSEVHGVAKAAAEIIKPGTMIGKALENYDSNEVGTIIISVGRT